MEIIRTSGIVIPSDFDGIESIKLNLEKYITNFNGTIKKVTFYENVDNNNILIPRFYPLNHEVINNTEPGVDIDIECIITPRNEAQQKAIDFFIKNDSGILRMEPGRGKTVVTIAAISKIKKKTIIFAHKDNLIKQWTKEILDFTNLNEDDIGRLFSNNYKEVFNKKIILSSPHIISNAAKTNNKEFFRCLSNAYIGVMIVDECHVGVGPEKFSKSSIFIPSKKTFGLSATPSRMDNTEDIMKYHLGKITYIPPSEDELLIPKVYMIHFSFGIYNKFAKYIYYNKIFNTARYYKQMIKIPEYFNKVSTLLKKAYGENRHVLVLGNRIDSLIHIAETSNLDKDKVGIFIPGATNENKLKVSDTTDLETAFKQKQIVISTYGACRDGNNRPELDFLIMSCPTGNVEQAAGRILRVVDNKKRPIVLDLVDTDGPKVNSRLQIGKQIGYFERSAEYRFEKYQKLNWEVHKIIERPNGEKNGTYRRNNGENI